MITTTEGDLDVALLLKTEGGIDNDCEQTTWVEYCRLGCHGEAHQSGRPDAPGVFCARHIHRSVAITLKCGVFAEGVAADFGKG